MKEYTKNLGKVVMTPKGAWSIEKEYEILDIVHDSVTDHAYISKQEVPSGVDLSDSRYWMPLNVSGYSDSNVITLNSFNEGGEIQSYTLEEAIKSIKDVGRKSGAILIFYNDNVNRLDITTGCWEIWQFNSINVYDWENLDAWTNIYYNYNKFVGWYAAENVLNKEIPNPDVGCYAFVGNIYNEAFVYRCDVKNRWTKTNQKAQYYIKVVFGDNVVIGGNGNWWQDGIDTNIPVSVKGDNGLTPYLRWSKNNQIEYSYDNTNWYILSDKFNTNIKIKDYVNTIADLPNNIELGTIYGVGPIYAEDDTEQTNPIYNLYVYTSNGWINNGRFNSISAGVAQDKGNSITEVMSQDAVTKELTKLELKIGNQKGLSTDIDIDNLPSGILSFTATSVPEGLPNIDYGAGATIITTRKSDEKLSYYDRQVLITKQYICTRTYYNEVWTKWEESQVTSIQLGLISSIDIDNLPNSTLSFTATFVPNGLPNIDYGAGALLITIRNNSLKNLDRQFIVTKNAISTRAYYNGWQLWETTDIDAGGKFLQKGLITNISVDNLPNGILSFTSSSVPNGLPNIDYSAGAFIVTVRHDSLSDFDRQFIVTKKLISTRAYYKGAWTNWEISKPEDNIIHCGQGQKYTRLRDAVAAAIEVENTKVIIHPGVYDLANEFAEEIANHRGTGIVLHNGVHLIFMAGSYVTCEIDVSNEWAYSNFEPFSAYKDFTLENAHIVCRNTRYCVHDELNGASTYRHRYINCHMEYTNEHTSANFTQCIGGGMGEHGYVEIVGGYYKSFSLYHQSNYKSADDMQQPITFHNGINATCDGKIVIKDVFLADKGYFRFGMYGGSSKKTPIYISGCRMYKEPFLMNELWNDSQVQNMEVIAWNNEIVA